MKRIRNLAPTPVAPSPKVVMTPEELRAFVIERLQRLIDDGEESRQEFVSKSTNVSEFVYQIRWLGSMPITLYKAEMARTSLEYMRDQTIPPMPLVDQLNVILEEHKRQLMRWYPERSTSPWSNEMRGCEFEANRSFIEQIESLLHDLKYYSE